MLPIIRSRAQRRALLPGVGLVVLICLLLTGCGAATSAAPTPTAPLNGQICGPGCGIPPDTSPTPTSTPTPPSLVVTPTHITSVTSNQVNITLSNPGTQVGIDWKVGPGYTPTLQFSVTNGSLAPRGQVVIQVTFNLQAFITGMQQKFFLQWWYNGVPAGIFLNGPTVIIG